MENSLSKTLIETFVRSSLKNCNENPDRVIRNLVDMALQFSNGRFQRELFTFAQDLLQDENSAYYRLARNVLAHIDTEHLITFGMNLGYNGCTKGAKVIRENEEKLGCNIPWVTILEIDTTKIEKTIQRYNELIQEGEDLGIFVWALVDVTKQPTMLLPLIKQHPDSAFILFCEPEDVTTTFLENIKGINNLMITVELSENGKEIYSSLENNGLLYSLHYPYGKDNIDTILNGEVFNASQQYCPLFTILLPKIDCTTTELETVSQAVNQIRLEPSYSTIPWDMYGDNRRVDAIISDDSCSVFFDKDGYLKDLLHGLNNKDANLFEDSLKNILINNFAKENNNTK